MATATDTPTETASITVDKKDLANALAQVMPAVSSRSLPVLTGVRLRTVADGVFDGGTLEILGTDLELWVKTWVPIQATGDFECVVGARYLQRILKEATGPVRFEKLPDTEWWPNGRVLVSWGRVRIELTLWPFDEFPRQADRTWGDPIELGTEDVDRIRRIATYASDDDARPILCGLRFSNEWPAGVAGTDSYRLGVAALEATLPDEPFLLPSRVVRFLPPKPSGQTATMWVDHPNREAKIAGNGLEIRINLIEGEFPPIAKLIPEKPHPHRVTVDRAEMIQAVRNAMTVMEHESAAPVQLETDKQVVDVIYRRQDVGFVNTEVDAKKIDGGEPPKIAFNPRYFLELLNTLEGDEITIETIDALKPAIVREEPWNLLIMPVRVS